MKHYPIDQKKIADILWQFHNDRLTDPSINEMKPYIEPIEKLLLRARIDEAKKMYRGVEYSLGLEARAKKNIPIKDASSVIRPLKHHIEVLEGRI